MFDRKIKSNSNKLRLGLACFFLLGLFFMGSVVRADPLSKIPDVAFYGIGGLECNELTSNNPILGHRQEKLLHWVTGYMSGIAAWMKSEGFEASVPWDKMMVDRLRPFLLEYCRSYPSDKIASAAASFYKFRLVPKPIK